ncbi:aldehyde dehydrogenase family protein [Streptomyces sp. DSM 44917]|uniref:Aldehyde dehydrogenase family protein n=1 Tax=Streptomyces boetiae TaxID=3075541 RepID=A0ABU2LDD4_9ACTN|nr:aldehyde dehydrogenase family protein [Streptomyces sp. DSM 44917]MDT0309586.1 aldehyde dehydrogenase family protein [Streptomyces sp. DSM 44917]
MTTPELAAEHTAAVDRAVAELVAGESAWAVRGLAERRELLERVHAAVAEHAEAWVTAAAQYKQLPADSPLLGEEWTAGPFSVLSATAALVETIRALEAGRSPVEGFPVRPAPGGRIAVKVLPHDLQERLMFSGFSAEVWMPPGVTEAEARQRAGLGLLNPAKTGGVGVVLGAGNVTSIPVLDVLYELYANNRVAALKLNPVTDGLAGVYADALAPLIEAGAVRVLTGGVDVGGYLVNHPDVSHVHMTGSAATHDAIVFGPGEEGAARRAANTPVLDKPVTSELGGVSPVIVLPGEWSEADLRFQAEHVATQRLHNNGYNCVASQVLVLSADWPQKDRFLALLRETFDSAPERPAYYPGSDNRLALALDAYPSAHAQGGRVLIDGLDPAEPGPALRTEYFAPVLAVIELPGTGREFLDEAVRTANEDCAGTLGVNILAHPKTLSSLGAAFDEALAALRYGTIAVNAWTGFGYQTARAPWGAFPGHTLDDVQSGIGVVHNALLLDGPERTVVRGPFRPAPRSVLHGEPALSPRPPWFVTNRTAATTGRRLVGYAAERRWSALPGVVTSALRG